MNLHHYTNTCIRPASSNIEVHDIKPYEALKRQGQTQQDLIRLLDRIYFESELQKEALLQMALPGWDFTSSLYSNGPLSYAVRDCARREVRQAFSNFGEPYGAGEFQFFYQAGTWVNSTSGATGTGIVSLLAHILGAPILDVIAWIAATLGINLDAHNIQQTDVPANHKFIARPEILAPAVMPAHWLLGLPAYEYGFTTEFNSLSFVLKEWRVSNEIVRLFCTFCRSDKTGAFNWLFVRPPVKEILFNKHRLYRERSLPVCIYDDIALAAQHADHPDFVATWSGGVDFTANIEWSLLAGREVTYASPLVTQNSFIIGETLHNTLNEMQTNLTLEKIDEAYCA